MINIVLLSINGLSDLSHGGFERGFGCYFVDLEGLVYKESLSKKKKTSRLSITENSDSCPWT